MLAADFVLVDHPLLEQTSDFLQSIFMQAIVTEMKIENENDTARPADR